MALFLSSYSIIKDQNTVAIFSGFLGFLAILEPLAKLKLKGKYNTVATVCFFGIAATIVVLFALTWALAELNIVNKP
ncbi:hypothetical protein [Ruegeria sp. HKCCA4008]|uniref:hypothetical protein n=1 Tax=Ruegeria sp. HKCCA4008 TaxID=2682999 RepID=UPI001487FAB0|nr:hypothetical protein [Ruegeria sp. HKCCA4008]